MVRNLLVCGLVAGACAGLAATAFAALAGAPAVDAAIAFEDAQAAAAGLAPAPRPVSREVQRGAGLALAAVVYGVALGGLFALAFAAAYGRVARAGPARTAGWLAAAAFVVVFFVPFVKYPASPPSVGDPATIGERTLLYVTMVAISLLAAVAAVRLRASLAARRGPAAAGAAGGALFVAAVAAAALALPGADEVPRDFPATALWRLREASVGMHAVLWLALAAVFAPLAQRVLSGRPIVAPARGAG